MPFDPLIVARQHRNIRSQSQQLQAYNTHIPHIVMQNETLDASLSHRLVYKNRADWYASAAMNGFCDVDLAQEIGLRRYLTAAQINATNNQKNNGMSLYE